MKKIKYYKTLLTLVMAGTISFVSGCGGTTKSAETDVENDMETEVDIQPEEESKCEHFITDFGGETVIFKECEVYIIDVERHRQSSSVDYIIRDENYESVFSGTTDSYNWYRATHEYISEVEPEDAKVFKLK